MSDRPVLHVVAGPNGSGKSTYTSASPPRVPLLDPDAVARLVNPVDPRAAAVEAGRRVAMQSASLIAQRQSFAVETTLAGNHPLRLMESARKAGYRINLVFIGLQHPALGAERVAARVARGGHDVPLADIERRFERSTKTCPRRCCSQSKRIFSTTRMRSTRTACLRGSADEQ